MVLVRAWIIGKKKKKMVGKLKQFFFVCQFLSEYRLDGGKKVEYISLALETGKAIRTLFLLTMDNIL